MMWSCFQIDPKVAIPKKIQSKVSTDSEDIFIITLKSYTPNGRDSNIISNEEPSTLLAKEGTPCISFNDFPPRTLGNVRFNLLRTTRSGMLFSFHFTSRATKQSHITFHCYCVCAIRALFVDPQARQRTFHNTSTEAERRKP